MDKESRHIISTTLLTLCVWSLAFGTHNRAGEITYVQLDELTIECTVTTYTKESSTNADRDSIIVFWGDGLSEVLIRENGPNGKGVSLGNDIKKNVYRGQHTFPGRGTYSVSLEDPNRIADIENIPNSVNVKFFIFTRITLLGSTFQGINNSVQLLEPPIDVGCVGQPFIHNPNAFDADGDSLSFELVTPYQGRDSLVKDYLLPSQVAPGPGNSIFLDGKTGEFKWLYPPASGDYNIAIQINEYRQGVLISSMIRDMQIQILECNNHPPTIFTAKEICVVAGDTIDIEIIVSDPDSPADPVLLTATGGAFLFKNSPSSLIGPTGAVPPPLKARFYWETKCEHIRDQPYLIVLKATDVPNTPPALADIHTLQVKIVGPQPQNLSASTSNQVVQLEWDAPYACDNMDNDYFYGFSVWRRQSSHPFVLDTCIPGLEGMGYEIIDFKSLNRQSDHYVFEDHDVSKGITYCYRVLGEFALTSPQGNPYNFTSSLASEEVCIQLDRDQPILLNVDVLNTDPSEGVIKIRWARPIPEELDTLQFPGPYSYVLQRSIEGANAFSDLPKSQVYHQHWFPQPDSTFEDSLINTLELAYDYRVDFRHGTQQPFKVSETASSIFVTTIETDRTIILNWEERVPWTNIRYYVLRQNTMGGEDTIGITQVRSYTDRNLINGNAYCYRILAEGTYAIQSLDETLWNHSQSVCGTPIDTVAPCPPEITASNDCEGTQDDETFYNLVEWQNPISECSQSNDIARYIVYYRASEEEEWKAIDTVDYGSTTTITHQPEKTSSGCYVVTTVDSVGNESRFSNFSCVENCPLYELPNAFTPNHDGANDLFVPRKSRFIARVDFKVFNKWGQLVFQTEDPNIEWNGKNMANMDLNAGTYYYTCKVFEERFDGIYLQDNILSGYIELNRGQ